ncbi:MAG: site-specific integrase [Verrucomicrobiota bacterium]
MMTLMMTFMASTYKDPKGRSPYWYVSFFGADGRQVRKSTKTTDKKLADRLAVEWEELADAGRKGSLTETQARKVVSEIVEKATGTPLQFATAADYLTEWIKTQDGAIELASFRKYSQAIREFIESLGDRSKLALGAVSSADVTAFRDKSARMGRTPGTIKGLLKPISKAFEQAHKQGLIPHNPCKAVPSLKDREKKPKECFTPAQIQTLLSAADTEWKGLILFGYFTGMRLQDIAHLTWENVDLENEVVSCKERKTGKHNLWELHPNLLQWLKARGQGLPKTYVLPELKSLSEAHLSRSFTRFMARAGVVGALIRKKTGEAGRNLSGLTFHSLRHTFVSGLDAQGVPEELRMKIVGHSSVDVHRNYTHHKDDRLRGIIAGIPGIL